MEKKAQKRIELLRKKVNDIQQRLAGAGSRWTTRAKSVNWKPTLLPPNRKSKS